jgi:uncharacterized protein
MTKESDHRKEFKLTHDFDALTEFLDEIENPDEGDFSDDSDINIEFLAQNGDKILFLHPQLGHHVSAGFVIAHSTETINFIKADNFYDQDFSRFQPLIALPGNKLAIKAAPKSSSSSESEEHLKKDRKIERRKLKNGTNVAINDSCEFIAEQYGFIILRNGTLSIISPLYVPHDKLRIDWILSPDMPTDINRQMIEFWLSDAGIASLPGESLNDLIESIQAGIYEPGHYAVFSGNPPVPGEDGKIEWLVDIHLSPGKELPDGKIDFRERNYVVSVTEGQMLGVLKPPTQGTPGSNIFGLPLPARDGIPLQIEDGEYVRKEEKNEDIVFFSEINGAFHFDNKTVFITDVLILPEGVNYKTGNISFGGDVVVEGNVESGFSIKAGGDIIITESVEDGSTIEALGKITVGSFINGNRVIIKAGLSVYAQYVNEAVIKAGRDIILGNYVRHAKLRAQGLIKVKKNYGKLGGSLVGGESWAGQKIDVHIAGSEVWIKTELVAGISPKQAEKLDQIQESIEEKNNHMRQILGHFGLLDIDLKKLKSIIESEQGIKKKSMALRAKYLVKTGKQLQMLLAEKVEIEDKAGPTPKDAEVVIREKAHPSTIIAIGKSKRKIDSTTGPTRFYLQNDVMVTS